MLLNESIPAADRARHEAHSALAKFITDQPFAKLVQSIQYEAGTLRLALEKEPFQEQNLFYFQGMADMIVGQSEDFFESIVDWLIDHGITADKLQPAAAAA